MPSSDDVVEYYSPDSLSVGTYDVQTLAFPHSIEGDVEFYARLAGEPPARILEVGVGTGRVAWRLGQRGHLVTGVDTSPAMLELAERKRARQSAEVSARVSFALGDMVDLALPGDFDLILAPFYAFNHLADDATRLAALRRFRQHMHSASRAAIHALAPDGRIDEGQRLEDNKGKVNLPKMGVEVTFRAVTRDIDKDQQQFSQVNEFVVRRQGGTVVRSSRESLTYSWFTDDQIRRLFDCAGLAVERHCTSFKDESQGCEGIWVLRAA